MEGSYMPRVHHLGLSYGISNLDAANQLHPEQHQQFCYPPQMQPQSFNLSSSYMTDSREQWGFSNTNIGRNSTSDDDEDEDDEPSHGGGGIYDPADTTAKQQLQWNRVKWNGTMVKLLVTAAAYIDEDVANDYTNGGRRKFVILKKKGKWKLISSVMEAKGFLVSPQQCEDKFNDLNKRYKRLTDILGRGTSCKVVENPALLDALSLPQDVKGTARKMLSSKHLYYEEMCSYHNHNLACLLDDPGLRRSLRKALRSKDDCDMKSSLLSNLDENDHEKSSVDHTGAVEAPNPKRLKTGIAHCGSSQSLDVSESRGVSLLNNPPIVQSSVQLEAQQLEIRAQMLELERQKLKWTIFSKKKDKELEKMKFEIEVMRMENNRLALQVRQRELELVASKM